MSDSPSIRERNALFAHLAWLSVQVRMASVTLNGEVVQGRFGNLRSDGSLPFHPHAAYQGRLPLPGRMARVRVDYCGYGVNYAFHTRVREASYMGAWVLYRPRDIQRRDRRMVHRYELTDDPGFGLRLTGPWEPESTVGVPLVDLSADGAGFTLAPHLRPASPGLLLAGELSLPEGIHLPVLVDLSRVDPSPDGQAPISAGGSFRDLPPADRQLLALTLSVWDQRRRQN